MRLMTEVADFDGPILRIRTVLELCLEGLSFIELKSQIL